MKSQRITKVITAYPSGKRNVCTTFHGHPSRWINLPTQNNPGHLPPWNHDTRVAENLLSVTVHVLSPSFIHHRSCSVRQSSTVSLLLPRKALSAAGGNARLPSCCRSKSQPAMPCFHRARLCRVVMATLKKSDLASSGSWWASDPYRAGAERALPLPYRCREPLFSKPHSLYRRHAHDRWVVCFDSAVLLSALAFQACWIVAFFLCFLFLIIFCCELQLKPFFCNSVFLP